MADSKTVAKASVMAAVLEVRKSVPVLAHDSTNEFSSNKYRYASIDAFYERVKPEANAAGLGWRASITGWELLPDLGKYGSISAKVRFDLFTKDDIVEDYMTVPIINGFVGAQTTGQIVSYAEKVMMRAAFGVATGEGDADHTDQSQFSQENKPKKPAPKPEPKPEPKIEAAHPETGEIKDYPVERKLADGMPVLKTRDVGADILVAAFETFMGMPKTRAALRDWWAENVPAMEAIGRADAAKKAELIEKFRERAATLPEK